MESYLNNLPCEILIRIFEYQSSTVELKHLALVCKKWMSIVEKHFKLSERIVLKSNLLSKFININSDFNNPEPILPLIRKYKNLSLKGSDLQSVIVIIKNLDLKHLSIKNMKFSEAAAVLEMYKDTLEAIEFKKN